MKKLTSAVVLTGLLALGFSGDALSARGLETSVLSQNQIQARLTDRQIQVILTRIRTNSESLLTALDLKGIAASGGSACSSGSIAPSHVLAAMGVSPELASAAIRMSLGALTTDESVSRVVEVFPALVQKARQLSAAG